MTPHSSIALQLVIATDTLKDLAVVLGTAMPVIVVAFYAAVNAADDSGREGHDGGDEVITLPIGRAWAGALSCCLWRALLRRYWHTRVVAGDRAMTRLRLRRLRISGQFKVGTGFGFAARSTSGLLLAALVFLLVDEHELWAARCAAASLVLTVFSLNALICYSSILTSATYERHRLARQKWRETEAAQIAKGMAHQAGDETGSIKERAQRREMLYAWRLILWAYSFSAVTSVVALVAGYLPCTGKVVESPS